MNVMKRNIFGNVLVGSVILNNNNNNNCSRWFGNRTITKFNECFN